MGFNKARLAREIDDPHLKPSDKAVLIQLATECHYNPKTKKEATTCSPGDKNLAKWTNLDDKTIPIITARLEKLGYIQKVTKGGRVSKKNTVWQVNLI